MPKRSRSSSSEESDEEWMRRKMRRLQEKLEDRIRESKRQRGYDDRDFRKSSKSKYRNRSSSKDNYSYRDRRYESDNNSQTGYSDDYNSDNDFKGFENENDQQKSGLSARDPDTQQKEAPPVTGKSDVSEKRSVNENTGEVKGTEKNSESEKVLTANSLSAEKLKVIGNRIDPERILAPEANEDLVVRVQAIIKKGLPEEEKKLLLTKFPPPKNCLFIDPPKINAEVKAALQDSQGAVLKRDLRISEKQQKISASLGGLMNLASFAFTLNNEKKLEMLGMVSSLLRILSDLQFEESSIRRSLILKNIDASLRETLNSTQAGEWLFGENLEDRVKASKVLATSGGSLKMKKQQPSSSLKNSRGPVRPQPARRSFPQTGQKYTTRGQKSNYKSAPKKPYTKGRN